MIKVIKKSLGNKIIILSLLGFFLGIGITFSIFYITNKAINHHGVGGLETVAYPEFTIENKIENFEQNIESSFLNEFENQTEVQDFGVTYQTYRVKKGDMIGFIASEFNVTQDTIISVNNIRQSRLIQPGQYLKIPSMPGIVYTVKNSGETPETIAQKYEINAEKCALVNFLDLNSELKAGTSLFVPDAELDWATRQEINGDLFHRPIRGKYWLSSPYGWRNSPFNSGKRTFHSGIDMAIANGTPVYAALDGKVTTTGFNSTYGNYIIITHHSGYRSLYAHLSSINCKKGNFVYTNTMIGRVGSTGMSTGPHLHFTVYKNGKTINPSTLIN